MPTEKETAQYKLVRGLSRGLELLRALNTLPSGRATSSELAKLIGLHRTTVRRMLETLVEEGYVRRSDSDDSFCLTFKVRQLSEGFTGTERLSMVASPVMGELLQKVVWPSDLCTPDGDAMRIVETTHRFSPLSFHRSMVGRRLPFLLSAAGRAYFAGCGDEEREQILQIIRSNDDAQGRLAHDAVFLKNLVRTVRADGFATNKGEMEAERKIGAIAMPVRDAERVLGSVNIVFLIHALSMEQAIKKFVEPLNAAVTRISELLKDDASPR
jgi:IclR family mhp operon transcriptional activator